MYEYLSGKLAELNPSFAVVDIGGIGYHLEISLTTYSQLQGKENCLLFVHFIVREDAQILFGFTHKTERELFRLLISVSGIGPNTARIMLSSLSPEELVNAIRTENVNLIKSVKGIGEKTAQRVIIELKDKTDKLGTIHESTPIIQNSSGQEALSALVMLGFPKKNAEKAVDAVFKEKPSATVEQIVKEALKRL